MIIFGMAALVSTPQAAKDIGVGRTTLNAWVPQGKVVPTWITPGGQYRWDVDDLRRQLGLPPKQK